MFYILALLIFSLSLYADDSKPFWVKSTPKGDGNCHYVVGTGESEEASEDGRVVASKRATHDAVVKILKELRLEAFDYELRLFKDQDGEKLEEIKSQKYPEINPGEVKVIQNYWQEKDQGVRVYSLICYDPTKVSILKDETNEDRTIEVTIDSSPHVWQVSNGLFNYETPVTLFLRPGESTYLEFYYSKDKKVKVAYTPKASDHRSLRVFNLDVEGIRERPEKVVEDQNDGADEQEDGKNIFSFLDKVTIPSFLYSSEEPSTRWDLNVGFLAPTVKSTGRATTIGLDVRYVTPFFFEIGGGFNSGKWEKQGDGLNNYTFNNYGIDLKFNFFPSYEVFEGRSVFRPYLKYSYYFWNQSVTETGPFIQENTQNIKSRSQNFNFGIELKRNAKEGAHIFLQYQRIQFLESTEMNSVQNSSGVILGFGSSF